MKIEEEPYLLRLNDMTNKYCVKDWIWCFICDFILNWDGRWINLGKPQNKQDMETF